MTDAAAVKTYIEQTFRGCGDLNVRKLVVGGKTLWLANIGGFSSRDYLSEHVVRPLLALSEPPRTPDAFFACLQTSEVRPLADKQSVCGALLAGMAVVFGDGEGGAVVFGCMARNDPARAVNEPESEVVVRGPREGFVESAETNVALLRKRLRTEKMKVVTVAVGTYSATSVRVVYIEGVADKTLVETVLTKIQGMTLPAVMDSGYVEQFLTGKYTLFTEVGNSEKPDKVAAKLVEGRVAILCDGSPVVLTVPYLFVESLQSAEDYLKTPYYATFIRLLRIFCLFVSLYLPAFYIAILAHHKNAVPHLLYEKIVSARHDVPFSVFGELLVILLIFEVIREVGVRMPGAVGDAVSIVAGLVLGDAAVSAGIASAPVIMVAAFTAICTFMLPPFMNAFVLVRFLNTLAARLFGVAGIAVSLTVLLLRLCGKTSFGTPYFQPFAPLVPKGLTDAALLLPKKALLHADKELKS